MNLSFRALALAGREVTARSRYSLVVSERAVRLGRLFLLAVIGAEWRIELLAVAKVVQIESVLLKK